MSSDLLQMYRSWMLVTGDMKRRQPKLAKAIQAGRNLFVGELIERAIASRQPGRALILASRLFWHDPTTLAGIVFSRARGIISRRWRQAHRSQFPALERFVIGDPALPSRDKVDGLSDGDGKPIPSAERRP